MHAKQKLEEIQCRDSLTESVAIEAMRKYAIDVLVTYAAVSESYAKYLINDFEGEIVFDIPRSIENENRHLKILHKYTIR